MTRLIPTPATHSQRLSHNQDLRVFNNQTPSPRGSWRKVIASQTLWAPELYQPPRSLKRSDHLLYRRPRKSLPGVFEQRCSLVEGTRWKRDSSDRARMDETYVC